MSASNPHPVLNPDTPNQFTPDNESRTTTPGVSEVPLADDLDKVGPDDLSQPGLTLSEAEDKYIGRRQSEAKAGWEGGTSNTLHGTARRRYARILAMDRQGRADFKDPIVGMLTLVGPERGMPRVDYASEVTKGIDNPLSLLHSRKGGPFYWAAVRDATRVGFSHWHVFIVADEWLMRDDCEAAVRSYIRNTDIALYEDHPMQEAVKLEIDPEPLDSDVIEDCTYDFEHAQVFRSPNYPDPHPLAQYTASSVPHLGNPELGGMSPEAVTHGTIEWATHSQYGRGTEW